MSVDLSRVASAASAAALDDGKPRRRGLTGMRAVVLGAALGTAARLAVARAPVPDFARLPDLVCERLADRGLLPEDEEDFDEGGEVEPEAKTSDEEPAAEAEPQAEHRADRTVAPVQLRQGFDRGGPVTAPRGPRRDAQREAAARRREAAARRRERTLESSRARREAGRQRRETNRERARMAREVSLVDLVDRLLDGGVVIHGDITLAVADVDLLYVGLRALVASVETMERELGVSMSARGPALESSAL